MTRRPVVNRRARERETKARFTLYLAVGLALAFLGVTSMAVFLAREWNPDLTEDLCPVDRAPTSETVLIVDGTDPWSPVQRLAIEQRLEEIQEQVPRFGRVHLFTVRPEAGPVPEALLELCNPGLPSDFEKFPIIRDGGSRLVANPEQLTERWRSEYKAKLDAIVLDEGAAGESAASPIMETLRTAALRSFGEAAAGSSRQVMLISDLMQNSPEYSVYSDSEWSSEDGVRLAATNVLGTRSLRDVSVQILYMERLGGRPSAGQGASNLIELWDSYIGEQGGLVMRVQRIEG